MWRGEWRQNWEHCPEVLWSLGCLGAVREQCSISVLGEDGSWAPGELLLQDAVEGEREELLIPNLWWETRKSEEEAAKGQVGRQPLHVLCSGGLYGFSVTCQLVTATLSSAEHRWQGWRSPGCDFFFFLNKACESPKKEQAAALGSHE